MNKKSKKELKMKKMLLGLLTTLVVGGTAAVAGNHYIGQITYVQVRADGLIAIKVLPDGATDEVYGAIKGDNPEKVKAMYAMALTALSTGKPMEAWKDDAGWWDTFFLRK
jgi:hypothetical protein